MQILPPAEKKERVYGRPFQKGVSGNPSGRTIVPKEVRELARKASPDAMKRLVELIKSDDERVAYMAAQAILDRAYGKARPAEDDTAGKAVQITVMRLAQSGSDTTSERVEAKVVSAEVVGSP